MLSEFDGIVQQINNDLLQFSRITHLIECEMALVQHANTYDKVWNIRVNVNH